MRALLNAGVLLEYAAAPGLLLVIMTRCLPVALGPWLTLAFMTGDLIVAGADAARGDWAGAGACTGILVILAGWGWARWRAVR